MIWGLKKKHCGEKKDGSGCLHPLWSSAGDVETPESLKSNRAAEKESVEPTIFLEQLETKGKAYGKMLLKSGLKKRERKKEEQSSVRLIYPVRWHISVSRLQAQCSCPMSLGVATETWSSCRNKSIQNRTGPPTSSQNRARSTPVCADFHAGRQKAPGCSAT